MRRKGQKNQSDLTRISEVLDLQNAEIERLREELNASLKYAADYQRRYQEVVRSRSWRMTAPVRYLVNLLTGRPPAAEMARPERHHKRTIRSESAAREIEALRKQMLTRGFLRQAGRELIEIAKDESRPYHRRLAALELAVWHLNKRTPEGARQALALLPTALKAATSHSQLRRGAVLEAEAYACLGDDERARDILELQTSLRRHHDLYLSLANLEADAEAKLKMVNRAMDLCGLQPLSLSQDRTLPLYDRLTCAMPKGSRKRDSGRPLVSVIMPAHNSAETISTAIEAVLNQSWRNLELIVVDDCSADETTKIVDELADRDDRVRLIRAEINAGPYVARNLALPHVRGEFVTCHDADDWSHPEKIALQVMPLIENPDLVGNASMQARTTNQLQFYRRGNLGDLTILNYSSFIFRRVPVLNELGFWDSVRFAADSEFLHRAKNVFGETSIGTIRKGPLSFQRQSDASLTGNSVFGFHGFYMGARLAYYEAHVRHHQRAESLKYDFPQTSRPFGVPEPLWPRREHKEGSRRRYDIVIADDFRARDASISPLIEEIHGHLEASRRVGLVQLSRYDLNPHQKVHPWVMDLLDDENVDQIVYGEEISCHVIVVRGVAGLQEHQRFIPDIQAADLRVVVDSLPLDQPIELERCTAYLKEYFGHDGTWHPLNPATRRQFLLSQENVSSIQLSSEDWQRETIDGMFGNSDSNTG